MNKPEHWLKLVTAKLPRTTTRKQWYELQQWLRTVRGIIERELNHGTA